MRVVQRLWLLCPVLPRPAFGSGTMFHRQDNDSGTAKLFPTTSENNHSRNIVDGNLYDTQRRHPTRPGEAHLL